MQNFSNSPAPSSLPPGFSGRSGAGPPYPSQPAEPQISPRMTDDYAGMQQQSLHRGHPHPGQASHMLAYSSRNRGAVELPPAHASMHSGNSNNPYRKAPMEYYFSVGGKDRSRTMGMGFGTSFGYPNMDGHIPHQYRPTGSGSTPPVGLMSPYPVDYGPTSGTAGGAGGAFSPSHQYNMAQNPAMQSVPSSQMQHRQHGQTFPSVHQQHRNYPQSGHRMNPQYPQYSPQGGGSTGSSGMYSPPPQRYLDGTATTGFDPKINSSPSVTAASNSGSVASNNVGPMENVQQSYHASNYAGYSPQTHSLHKQATLQHRSSQHNLGVGYDNSLKMQHQGSSSGAVYAKHQQASNPSIPQTTSLELAKSPMPPNAQQAQMNQNFSPISNPSPAASAVHSPSCSSSPSPLMGVSEAHGPSGHGPSHPPISNPRSNQGHARLLQTIPQLSPTPNSNSSISSCGSSGSHKAHSRTVVGCSVPPAARSKMGLGGGIGHQDESSTIYSSSHNKMQDSSLNSLNALSSQVANLPNTVQHMILTDTVLSQKRGKDELLTPSQPRSRNASATSSTSTIKDGGVGVEVGPEEEQFSDEEHGRRRQMSGASSGSEPSHPPASQSQQQASNAPQAKEAGEVESKIGETGPKPHSPPSSISCSLPNSISEHLSTYNENGVSLKKNTIMKNEIMKNAVEGVEKKQKLSGQNVDIKTQNSQVKESKPHAASRLQNNEREEKHTLEEQQSASSVGVIVSARSEASLNEKNKPESTEEKQPRSRDSSSHNGEEGVDLSLSSHQRSHLGLPQNLSQTGPQKYGYPEPTYGSDLSMKNRGRTGLGGVIESNSKYAGYQQSQTSSVAEPTVKRGRGPTAAQGDNAQMQQFPSLLQEVLQGYNLDRRYGRPEQVYPANLQHQFQNRHQYSLTESMQMQSDVTNAQLGSSEKNLHPKQRNANESDFATEASVKLELSGGKCSQKTEKSEMGISKSTLPHATDAQQPPPKHINLADYSLPQRKALSHISTHSSAVQELLLQEPEPLTASSGQSEAQKPSASVLAPSERRSVICDMSPNRRSTPERDRESDREREKSQSGASVIQQPFSSPAAANDVSKKDSGEKLVAKVEAAPKEADTGNFLPIHHTDVSRRGNVDAPSMPPHTLSTNPLSSPSRHQAYLRGMDLSTGNASSSFHSYTFGDMREGMLPRNTPHFPSHHPYHNISGQSQSANKLMYPPHPRAPLQLPQDMNDWFKAMSRTPKDVMMQPGSSPGRQKISQLEQRQRMMSHADMASDRSSMQSSFYDMKMWEATHAGRDGEAFYRTQPPPLAPPPPPVASHNPVPPEITPASNAAEFSASRGPTEETKHPCPNPMISTAKLSADIHSPLSQTQRQIKAGTSGDTNPLMLRRRVRSFISPIPAKRQLQDTPQQRAVTANSHHSPGAHSETSHHNEDDSSSSEISCPRLSSPLSRENTYSQALSPSNSNTKVTPPRKGRGLKLEAIVQKITPNIKKPAAHTDEEANHYSSFSHPNEMQPLNDIQNQDLTHFPKVTGRDDGYMDESHSLNDMIPFQRVDEAGPLAPSTYKPDSRQTSQTVKQKDFDFGIPASASGDKEDFALLGPLPPPPPLPRPVQGSPPPSSSALSDIQHFTSTYQQLETRRGEQSAANLLRQKLQESGMGFDDYPGSDYYGTTPPQGHMLSRQHQMSSSRSSLSPQDLKPQDNLVPKGYFPSGKKKGRPVGSVNKQKRAQNQGQTTSQTSSQAQPAAPHALPALSTVSTPATMAPQPAQGICSPESGAPPLLENKNATPPPLAPPILTQVSKVDIESEDTQPELEVKPVRRRRRGVKDEDEPFEAGGKQRRRRRGAAAMPPSLAKDDPDVPLNAGRGLTNRACLDPNRKGPFVPHIHVENKVPEIGAVCTIINAEEDKMKGGSAIGGKASSSGIDSLLTSALSSQLSRKDRESEKRETDEVETTLQSGKALPSSGYVVSGPVITETNHSGRLLCCLCQKWANYKNLGDLYGPYYPVEYVAKLPKNQPQVRQCQTPAGANKIGPNSETSSNSTIQDLQTKDVMPYAKPSNYSDYPISLDSYLSRTVQTAFPAPQEEMMHITERFSSTSPFLSSNTNKPSRLSWDMNLDIMHIPELKREPDSEGDQQKQAEETQLRPQHRKLTSHPRFKRRHKSSEKNPRMVPSNSKASLPFQPPPPALDSLGPLAQLAQLPQMPMDPEELWVHEACIVWTSGVYLVNGKLYGLQEALDGARETCCSFCDMVGSTLGCYSKGCTLRFHYLCALEADCSLNEDNFSLRCPKHKVKKESLPRASGHSSLYTWNSQKEAERSREENDQFEYGNCWFGLQMCDQ